MKFLLATLFVTLLPTAILASGVFAAVCDHDPNTTSVPDTRDCCAAIGGGSHFFNEADFNCESSGGIAFRRVSKIRFPHFPYLLAMQHFPSSSVNTFLILY
jgi:hypothetical protein